MPSLLSPHMLACFKFRGLKCSVRAAKFPLYQKIQDISRMDVSSLLCNYEDNANELLINCFRELILKQVTFVPSWKDVPNHAYRVFPRKAPGRAAENDIIAQMAVLGQERFVESISIDEQLPDASHGKWVAAQPYTIKSLDHHLKEPNKLCFYKFGLYQCTYNKHGTFSQSQLAVVVDVPTKEQVSQFADIEILLAPVGLKYLDFEIQSEQQLLERGWTKAKIGAAPSRAISLRHGIKGRRRQYALKHRIAGTIHSTIGSTLSLVATQISLKDPMHQLWEKGQVVVLLSRTRDPSCLIFVTTDPKDTVDALVAMILKETQYDNYMEHLLEVFITQHAFDKNIALQMAYLPFRPCDVAIPED